MNYAARFETIESTLRRALSAPTLEESRRLIGDALERTQKLAKDVAAEPMRRGRLGGTKTAERGPEYFRQISAMRKARTGGRPKKATSTADSPT
jgi:hypothetical protein